MFAKKLRRALCGLWGAVILLGAGNTFAGFKDLNLSTRRHGYQPQGL